MSQPNFDKKVAAKGEHRYKTTQNIYMKQNGTKEKYGHSQKLKLTTNPVKESINTQQVTVNDSQTQYKIAIYEQ